MLRCIFAILCLTACGRAVEVTKTSPTGGVPLAPKQNAQGGFDSWPASGQIACALTTPGPDGGGSISYGVALQPQARDAWAEYTTARGSFAGSQNYPLQTQWQQGVAAFAAVSIEVDAGRQWDVYLDISTLEATAVADGNAPGWDGISWNSPRCTFNPQQ